MKSSPYLVNGHDPMRSYDFSALSALLVDPNGYFRTLIKAMLHQFGFAAVYEAEDGTQGLELLTHNRIDVVFTEFAMSPMDGLTFVRKIRQGMEAGTTAWDPKVPIIMVTGHSEREKVLKARDAGITEFLAKPLSPRALFHRITLVVDTPRAFVRSAGYTGPDRRRFVHYEYDGPERRGTGAGEVEGPNTETRLSGASTGRRAS